MAPIYVHILCKILNSEFNLWMFYLHVAKNKLLPYDEHPANIQWINGCGKSPFPLLAQAKLRKCSTKVVGK